MRFLTCHPNDEKGYIEEADLFFSNPVKWLLKESHDVNKYSNIVSYSALDKVCNFWFLNKQCFINLLSANPTKCSNTLKQFVDN